jgi:hypothetical protein
MLLRIRHGELLGLAGVGPALLIRMAPSGGFVFQPVPGPFIFFRSSASQVIAARCRQIAVGICKAAEETEGPPMPGSLCFAKLNLAGVPLFMIASIIDALLEDCHGDLEPWRGIMDDNVHLRIASRPPALGVDAALTELRSFFSMVASIGRPYRDVWRHRQATLVETELIWAHLPSPVNGVPCVLIVRTGGRRAILDLRMYLDLSPLQDGDRPCWPVGR